MPSGSDSDIARPEHSVVHVDSAPRTARVADIGSGQPQQPIAVRLISDRSEVIKLFFQQLAECVAPILACSHPRARTDPDESDIPSTQAPRTARKRETKYVSNTLLQTIGF